MLIGRVDTDSGRRWVRPAGDAFMVIPDPFTGQGSPGDGSIVTGTLAAPVDPVVLIGLAQNGPDAPSPVQAWLKNPRSVVASGLGVTVRRDAGRTVAEAEIAIVIGRDTTGLTAATAHEYVLGVTAVNDLSSPDRTAFDPRNFEGKSGDGYTPLGPWIDTAASIDELAVSLILDDVEVAADDAASLPVSIRDALAYVTGWARLGPGDVIMAGAPRTAREVSAGANVGVRVGAVLLETPLG